MVDGHVAEGGACGRGRGMWQGEGHVAEGGPCGRGGACGRGRGTWQGEERVAEAPHVLTDDRKQRKGSVDTYLFYFPSLFLIQSGTAAHGMVLPCQLRFLGNVLKDISRGVCMK